MRGFVLIGGALTTLGCGGLLSQPEFCPVTGIAPLTPPWIGSRVLGLNPTVCQRGPEHLVVEYAGADLEAIGDRFDAVDLALNEEGWRQTDFDESHRSEGTLIGRYLSGDQARRVKVYVDEYHNVTQVEIIESAAPKEAF